MRDPKWSTLPEAQRTIDAHRSGISLLFFGQMTQFPMGGHFAKREKVFGLELVYNHY